MTTGDRHTFLKTMRINVCKAVVHDVTAFAKKEPNLVAFVLMGPPQRGKFTRSYGKKEPACKKVSAKNPGTS